MISSVGKVSLRRDSRSSSRTSPWSCWDFWSAFLWASARDFLVSSSCFLSSAFSRLDFSFSVLDTSSLIFSRSVMSFFCSSSSRWSSFSLSSLLRLIMSRSWVWNSLLFFFSSEVSSSRVLSLVCSCSLMCFSASILMVSFCFSSSCLCWLVRFLTMSSSIWCLRAWLISTDFPQCGQRTVFIRFCTLDSTLSFIFLQGVGIYCVIFVLRN